MKRANEDDVKDKKTSFANIKKTLRYWCRKYFEVISILSIPLVQ